MGGDPLLVVAGADLLAPGGAGEIPIDGVGEAGFPGFGGGPAEVALNFGAVDGIAAVVAGAVLDEGDEGAAGFPVFERRSLGIDEVANFFDDAEIGQFVVAADVVGRAKGGFLHNTPDGGAVVGDEEPVPDIEAIAVDGQGFAFEGIKDHEGDEFFRELEGAVIIRAVGEGGGQAVGLVVGAHKMVGGGLGGGVGGVGGVGGGLGEEARLAQGAEHFVGGDVVKKFHLVRIVAGGLQKGIGAEDIGVDKFVGGDDGAVDVAFGGEVGDGVDLIFSDGILDSGGIADVGLDEDIAVADLFGEVEEGEGVAGVGEFVEVDDARRAVLLREEPADEVDADEAGTAGDEEVLDGSGHGQILTALSRASR